MSQTWGMLYRANQLFREVARDEDRNTAWPG